MRTRELAKRAGLVVLVLAAAPALAYAFPQLVGMDGAFVVLSGSMMPELAPGDVIFVRHSEPAALRAGDVISFRPYGDAGPIVTHRIISLAEDQRLLTQGDANDAPDPWRVDPAHVIGVQAATLPKWGLLLGLLRSQIGYVVFVMLPSAWILAREFANLYRELAARERARLAAELEVRSP